MMKTKYNVYVAISTGLTFNISYMTIYDLPGYLNTLLTTTVKHNVYRPDGEPMSRLLEVGFALQNSNLSKVISGIGDTLTNEIRSNNPGDNYNASTITGKAFFNEPYIHVRWPVSTT